MAKTSVHFYNESKGRKVCLRGLWEVLVYGKHRDSGSAEGTKNEDQLFFHNMHNQRLNVPEWKKEILADKF